MKRLLSYIGSRRFAISLLVVTASIILLSNLLPKPRYMRAQEVEKLKEEKPLIYALSAKVGVERLTKSPYFQVIPIIIFASIAACTFRRFRAEIEKGERGEVIPEELPVRHSISLKPGSFSKDEAASMLRKKGWRLLVVGQASCLSSQVETQNFASLRLCHPEGTGPSPPEEGREFPGERTVIYGTKGGKGIWGSLAFHAGMEVALIGILISIITGMDGMLVLTEGFPVATPKEVRGLKDVAAFPFREIVLDSFEPVFEGGFPVRYDSYIAGIGRDGRSRKYTIGVNSLLKLDDYKFIFNRAGYAPRFRLKKDGKEVVDTVANLSISMPGIVDYFSIAKEGLKIKVEIFPDYYMENGIHKTKGKFPFNPTLFVEIEKFGKMIGRGFLIKGQVVDIESYSLEFVELKNWMELVISRDAGVPVIMAGFMLIAAGLCIRFILNDKRLWIIIRGNGSELEIGGKARFFPALFEEEIKRIAEIYDND